MNNGPMWKKKERKKNFLEPTASLYDVRTYAINRHIMRDQLRVSSEITRNLENEGPLVNRFFSGEKKNVTGCIDETDRSHRVRVRIRSRFWYEPYTYEYNKRALFVS